MSMRIIYCGNNMRGVVCLEKLIAAGFEIVTTVVHHGAAQNPKPGSVAAVAKLNGLPIIDPQNINSPESLQTLAALKPDLMVLVGYNQILRAEVIRLPPKGIINLHGGRLPNFRGGSPINWQIIRGETTGGCAIIYVDEGIDTGGIIAQEFYPLGPDETAGDVVTKTLQIFPRLLADVLKQIDNGTIKAEKQKISDGAYYCKRYPDDGLIRWDAMKASEVHNLVRGLNGPGLSGAFTYLNGEKVVIWETRRLDDGVVGPPGRIALRRDRGVVVICRDHGILVSKIRTPDSDTVLDAGGNLRPGKSNATFSHHPRL